MDGLTALLLAIIVLCLLSGFFLSLFKLTVAQARRIYWRCAALGAVAAFLCGYPDVARGIEMAACVVAAMMLMAMRATPYLKVRGKIYAFSAADRRAEDGNIPTTFGQDLTQAAEMLQRRFGDDDVPDTTGRNVTEALDALHRRFGSGDTSENAERDESEAVSSPSEPSPRTYVRVCVPGRGVRTQRLTYFLVALPVVAGGALMTFNPAPAFHRNPHAIATLGIGSLAGGIYLMVKALRAPAPDDTETAMVTAAGTRPHRHSAVTPWREYARLAALFAAVLAVGGGLLWWGISAKLLSIVGMSIAIIGPTLVMLAVNAFAEVRSRR